MLGIVILMLLFLLFKLFCILLIVLIVLNSFSSELFCRLSCSPFSVCQLSVLVQLLFGEFSFLRSDDIGRYRLMSLVLFLDVL